MNTETKSTQRFIILLLTLLAFALRVYRLDAQSLWWDEIFSIAIGRQPFPDWLILLWNDRGAPPGFYFLEALWTGISTDAFTVRFLDVMFGVLAIPLIYRLGKFIAGEWVGIAAALMLALSPFHIWYSQDARMYAPQVVFALAASYFFLQMLRQPSWRVVIGYALASVAIIYLHYHPFFLLAQMVFLVFFRRRYRAALKYWLISVGLIGLLYAPWFLSIFTTGGLARAPIAWVPPAQWFDPVVTLYVFLLGATNDPRAILNWLTFVIALMCAGWGMRTALRASRERDQVFYLLIWLVVPTLIIWAISLDLPIPQKRAAYLDRFLSPEFPALFLLIALGARGLHKTHPKILIAGAVIAFLPVLASLGNMYFNPAYARDDWRGVAEDIRTHADPARDLLLVRADQQLPLLYYDARGARMETIPVPLDSTPGTWVGQTLAKNSNVERLWLFSWCIRNNVHRFVQPSDEQRVNAREDAMKQALDAQFAIERETLYQGVLVTVYRVKP